MIREAKRLSHVSEYYFSRKLREVAGMVARGDKVLNLGIGSPDGMPSEATLDALCESARQPGNHGYQPYKGIPELRRAMAGWYENTYGVALDPEREILPLMGSKEGISHIAQAFLDPGDLALVPDPGYPTYTSAVKLAGAEVHAYDLRPRAGWEPDWDALDPDLLGRVKVWFVNYPHMPTGSAGSPEIFARILDLARKHDILVVNDNPYSLVLNEGRPVSLLQQPGSREVAIELNSLSKSHNMAGWRVGMLCGKQEFLDSVLKVKSNMDSGMFRPIQEAAVQALANPPDWHVARNAVYRSRREVAYALLDALGCTCDRSQTGMFLWAEVPARYTDAEELTEQLLHRAHVFLTPGFIFGNNGRRYLRISLCGSEDMLREALERIKSLEL